MYIQTLIKVCGLYLGEIVVDIVLILNKKLFFFVYKVGHLSDIGIRLEKNIP